MQCLIRIMKNIGVTKESLLVGTKMETRNQFCNLSRYSTSKKKIQKEVVSSHPTRK